MSMDFDFYHLTELPRQHALLHALVPGLAALDQTKALWLTGSLARGDADRWSSVDLHLLWDPTGYESASPPRPSRVVQLAIEQALGEENLLLELTYDSEKGGSFQGISWGVPSGVDASNEPGPTGVLLELAWTLSTHAEGRESPSGSTRLLYSARHLGSATRNTLEGKQLTVGPPDVWIIERQLRRFWLLLARLPAVAGRQEQLAAHMLLAEMSALLIDLVVSLNGGTRPLAKSRINQYLGPAQREAFEKSLGIRQSGRQERPSGGARWIGQAVALVVLYRWYAPQIVEKYSLAYPQLAEDSVLALLSLELENWPERISTG